uniref:PA domain-containing protein n=1 Tax=Eptatretus burgeri TaxID=7764 RepID=A0A8C4QUC6_EPTBU
MIQNCRVYWSAQVLNIDHRLVVATAMLQLKSRRMVPSHPRLDVAKLKYESASEEFATSLSWDLGGLSVLRNPEELWNGCSPIKPPPQDINETVLRFVALIRRHHCSFDKKVLHAQQAGFRVAIVYNVKSDHLLTMKTSNATMRKNINIPSVFVGQTTATLLSDYTYDTGSWLLLTPEFTIPMEYYLIPFLAIVGISFLLLVIFMVIKLARDRTRVRRSRLGREQLQQIPTHTFQKGEEV